MKTAHNMYLNDGPFNRIKNGTKTIEFDKIAIGYDKDDIANPEDMEKYYSKEEQNKYGVIGIEVRVI